MSELYRLHPTRTAPDCWELVAADHHPEPALRGQVVDVLPDDSPRTLADALAALARGKRPKVNP